MVVTFWQIFDFVITELSDFIHSLNSFSRAVYATFTTTDHQVEEVYGVYLAYMEDLLVA